MVVGSPFLGYTLVAIGIYRFESKLGNVMERQNTTVLVTNDGNMGPCVIDQVVEQKGEVVELAGDLQ